MGSHRRRQSGHGHSNRQSNTSIRSPIVHASKSLTSSSIHPVRAQKFRLFATETLKSKAEEDRGSYPRLFWGSPNPNTALSSLVIRAPRRTKVLLRTVPSRTVPVIVQTRPESRSDRALSAIMVRDEDDPTFGTNGWKMRFEYGSILRHETRPTNRYIAFHGSPNERGNTKFVVCRSRQCSIFRCLRPLRSFLVSSARIVVVFLLQTRKSTTASERTKMSFTEEKPRRRNPITTKPASNRLNSKRSDEEFVRSPLK